MWLLGGTALATVWVIASRFYHWPDKAWWIGSPATVLLYATTVPWPKTPKKKG
jgi:hypothetical protein